MDHRYRFAVLAALATVVLPGAASAQVDIEEISIRRGIELVADGVDAESAFAEVRVEGSGITSAQLELPGGAMQALTQDSGRWRLRLDFANAAMLDTDVPAGSYTLRLNGTERVVEIDYAFPAVPSPAIASPAHESDNNSPTTTPFEFTGCAPATCDDANDHVFVSILRGADVEASAFLAADSSDWMPLDAMGMPLELAENDDFVFVVENTAFRVSFEIVDTEDSFLLFNEFVHADRVDFSTGFRGIDEAPRGPFTIAVTDPAAPILDPSASLMTSLAGVDLDFDAIVDPNGRVGGVGVADIDGDTLFETPLEVRGRLSGRDGKLKQKLSIRVRNRDSGTEASASYTRSEEIDVVGGGAVVGEERLRGRILGVRADDGASIADSVAGEPVDWQLDFSLDTEDGRRLLVTDAELTYAGGKIIALEGRGSFDSRRASSNLTLRSSGADRGVSFQIQGLTFDAMGNPTAGTIRYKALGQGGRVTLP